MPFSKVSIIDFEQVNVTRELWYNKIRYVAFSVSSDLSEDETDLTFELCFRSLKTVSQVYSEFS